MNRVPEMPPTAETRATGSLTTAVNLLAEAAGIEGRMGTETVDTISERIEAYAALLENGFFLNKQGAAPMAALLRALVAERDALIKVARAVDQQMNDGETPVSADVEDAMSELFDSAPHLLGRDAEGNLVEADNAG